MNPRHFRDVLGQMPTGVVVITSRSAEDDTPIGMTLGTFTSVSLDPPLVAFLPASSSSTFPAIRDAGKFCVNILSSEQKDVAQAFATRHHDRFAGVKWRPAPQTGSPILEGGIAWVDCEIGDIHEAGDHDIVIGKVLDLELGAPGVPLVFFQGGYGTFTLRSLVLATWGKLNEHARIADTIRPELEALSDELGLECRVFAREGSDLIVVMTTGYTGPADRVGMVLPFCPPFGISFAAWGNAEVRDAWYERAPEKLSAEQRATLDDELDRVRSRGWTVSFSTGPMNEVGAVLEEIAQFGSTPSSERRLLETSRMLTADLGSTPELDASNVDTIRSITAPLLLDGEPALHLVLRGFAPDADIAFVENARDRLLAIARG